MEDDDDDDDGENYLWAGTKYKRDRMSRVS